MPISEKTLPKKPRESEEDKDEAATLRLCELAESLAKVDLNFAAGEKIAGDAVAGDAAQLVTEFHKLIKRSMHQKKDEVLYDALARTETISREACLYLKQAIEETAEITIIERAEGKMMEINVFVIPVFLHTVGGLDPQRCFQDQAAFEQLKESLQSGGLESPDATVVLVNHGYHLNEIDSITYSHLHEMLRDAFAAMTDKRFIATPAIDRSLSGWPDSPFGAQDRAIELRFLLGFSLKAVDDAFYTIPAGDSAADAYFSARQERFQRWAASTLPLVRRCFAMQATLSASSKDGEEVHEEEVHEDIHFLYQDLFHGGKERGIAEYFTLQLISELNRALQLTTCAPADIRATMGPIDSAGEAVLQVQLFDAQGALILQTEKPVPALPDWELEFDDTASALAMIGVQSISIAKKFTDEGRAIDPSLIR